MKTVGIHFIPTCDPLVVTVSFLFVSFVVTVSRTIGNRVVIAGSIFGGCKVRAGIVNNKVWVRIGY